MGECGVCGLPIKTSLGFCQRSAECRAAHQAAWRKSDKGKARKHTYPAQIMLERTRTRAKRRGVPCTITVEDIEIPELCPILGVRLEVNDAAAGDNSPSLDRIIPELGYVPGNVWVISSLANRMKSNATREQLVQFAEWVLKEHSKEEW